MSWSTCRPRARCTGRSCASAPRCARSRSIRSCACTTSRSPRPTCTPSAATSSACRRRWRRSGRSARWPAISPCCRACSRRCARAIGRSRSRSRPAQRLIGIWPGFVERAFGLAIDVGSTTIAGHLCDLHSGEVLASGGLMNPQIRFGEDLMSRVSYAMMNPGGVAEMTAAVRDALRTLIAQVTDEAGRRSVRAAGADRGRQPDHAPPAARHRSARARHRPLRARERPGPEPAGERARADRAPRRPHLHPALHRRPCRRRYRRRDPVRDAASGRRDDPDRRCRHQRRDRARQPPPPARRLLADRPGVRGRPDLLRPARGAGRDRAGADRPGRPSSRASR